MEVHNDNPWSLCRKEEGMGIRGDYAGQTDTSFYTPSHVKAIVKGLGLNIIGESNDNLVLYCPFHNNVNTPCFYISERTGAWLCFNPSCGEAGGLKDLVKRILGKNEFEVLRFIMSKKSEAEQKNTSSPGE